MTHMVLEIDCQTLAIVCIPKQRYTTVNGIGSGFTCIENIVIEAYSLGVDSCIVARAEPTFKNPEMRTLLNQWNIGEDYEPLMFLCLGYIAGVYPITKPRNPDRILFR